MRTHGTVLSAAFTLKTLEFNMSLRAETPTPSDNDSATEIFLPELHFPPVEGIDGEKVVDVQVELSGGRWAIERVDLSSSSQDRTKSGSEQIQVLKWWHAAGEQWLRVKAKAATSSIDGAEGDEEQEERGGTMQRCRENCKTM